MANSIKFDNTEILNTTYIPRYVKHESAPERDLNIFSLARETGGVLVSEKYGSKKITLTGYLIGTSKSDLETKIDSFKELFSRVEKNLDVDWEGSTRRYVATCSSHTFDRDYFHLDFVPWSAEFIVAGGVGTDTSPTTYKSTELLTENPKSYSVVFGGSSDAKPVITLSIGTIFAHAVGVSVEKEDTGEMIVYNKQNKIVFTPGQSVIVDFSQKNVTLGGVAQPFYGIFANFDNQTSTLKISFAGIIDQEFLVDTYGVPTSSYNLFNDEADSQLLVAQSFTVPYTDTTYSNLGLYIDKTGSPALMTVRIETDANNYPSGDLVDENATFQIENSYISTGGSWFESLYFTMFTLEANTRYWIVLVPTAGESASNMWQIPYLSGTTATYKRGNVSRSDDNGSSWTDCPDSDIGFKLYYGGRNTFETSKASIGITYTKRYL